MTNGENAPTLEQLNASTATKRYRPFSFFRIYAITSNTLTELTRLRVFYVLLVFALVLIGSSIFMAQFSFQQEFQILKDVSLGAISLFTSLLAIVATARLLPQDIVHTTLRQMSGAPSDQIADALRVVRSSAFNINIFPGIAVIYLKACLLAALTLFVSTFATSNIFTVVVMAFIYFIGHLQAIAREYWLQEHGGGVITRVFLAIVTLLFPDLQAFNLVDDIVAGTAISLAVFAKTALLGLFYTTVYTLLATFVFYGREL
jgi:hypothetical protein